ncbi:unnamed protein product [Polarella glacialis]|uniref:Uncharacterized protein n=2 Tax=Polarella glacialis TaxID=89957 RepID=A0A813EBQ5_POLGL|nr:unnamed protein product [Polarella glacialis]
MPTLDACRDVKSGERDDTTYFYNTSIGGSWWSREEAETETRDFYIGLCQRMGPAGRLYWVRGELHDDSLKTLFKRYRQARGFQQASR